MKQFTYPLLLALFTTLIWGTSCTKDPIVKPGPGGDGQPQPVHTNAFRLAIHGVSLQQHSADGLFTRFSVVNEQNDTLLKNHSEPLITEDGKLYTDSLLLQAGRFKLVSLLIMDAQNKVLFAAPISGSEKAALVEKPLHIGFQLPQQDVFSLNTYVLELGAGEHAQQFGYPEGSFGTIGNEPDDNNMPVRIKVQAMIKIGELVYDSIPASLSVASWSKDGSVHTSTVALQAGTNTIEIPASAVKTRLALAKWGLTDEMLLEKKDLDSTIVYTLGGAKAAKKLRSEISYIQNRSGGAYLPLSKNTYEYDGDGKLIRILYYLKRKDGTTYLANTDQLLYNAGGRMAKMIRYDEANKIKSELLYTYNSQGRLVTMQQNENGEQRFADLQYLPYPGTKGIGNFRVKINYRYPPQQYTMSYEMDFLHGNKVADIASGSGAKTEQGTYGHDFNINPYAVIGRPDFYLGYTSWNNVKSQWKQYTGLHPVADPHTSTYTYDSDGYPTQSVTSYFLYSQLFSHNIKTVYTY